MNRFIPIVTKLFWRTDNVLFNTNILWSDYENGKAIYQTLNNERLVETNEILHSMESQYVVNDIEFDVGSVIGSTCIPFEVQLVDKLQEQLHKLCYDLSVDIVISKEKIYPTVSNLDIYCYIIGSENILQLASFQVSMLMKIFKEEIVESISIPSVSLLPVLSGAHATNWKNISQSFKADVFITDLLNPMANEIFISGPIHSSVLLAKDLIQRMLLNKKHTIYYEKMVNLLPEKLKYASMFFKDTIIKLMIKFQCYISLKKDSIEFQASSYHLINLAMKQFTSLVLSQIFECQLLFHRGDFEVIEIKSTLDLNSLCSKFNVIILNPKKQANFIVIGDQTNIMKVVNILSEEHSKMSLQLKFFIELDPSFKDFISGKKNGKISKIMDQTKTLITLDLQDGNGNMILTLFSENKQNAEKGILLLFDELPSEQSFFIPEAYHRSVIGTGGSVIQTIMRKHNVFIQFSNSFQLPQNDFSHIRYDNVIIRCPSKNKKEIWPAKEELNLLASEYSKLQPNIKIKFSPGQYRYLVFNEDWSLNQLSGIEKKTGTYIIFPFEEPREDYELEIRGNDDSALIAANELRQFFGNEFEIRINNSVLISEIEFYNSIIIPFYSIGIIVTLSGKLIRFTFGQQGLKSFDMSLEILRHFLQSKGAVIIEEKYTTDFILHINQNSSCSERKSDKLLNENHLGNREVDYVPNIYIQYPYGHDYLK